MKAIIINTLLACAVGMALFVTPGCSTLPNKGFKNLKEGMTEYEVLLEVGRPHFETSVGGFKTLMWCENGAFGKTYWALHFTPFGRKLSHSDREIMTNPGLCKDGFRVWGDSIERRGDMQKDQVQLMLERID